MNWQNTLVLQGHCANLVPKLRKSSGECGLKEIEQIEGINAPANARVAAALKETTVLEFVDVPLPDGLRFIGDLHNIDVDIDHVNLKKAGIAPTTPVTIDVRSVKLHVALEIWLRPLKLGYVLRDGHLVVTARQFAVARNSDLPSDPDAATGLPKNFADKDEQKSDVANDVQLQFRKLQALESTPAGLRLAVAEYEQIYRQNRAQLVGLCSRFQMGICLQKLGDNDKAAAIRAIAPKVMVRIGLY